MKKSLTRKLAIAIIALVFAVVSLSTSTYAWFTMSDTANVDSFEATVKSAEGIEIGVTKLENDSVTQWYVGEVPSQAIKAVAEDADFKFEAITPNTIAYNNPTFKDQFNGEKTSGWVSFFVHIKAAQAGTVSIDDIALTTTNPSTWTVTAPYQGTKNVNYAVNDVAQYEVADAARVALITTQKDVQYFEKDATDAKTENGVKYAGNTVGITETNGAYAYYNAINPNNPLDDDNKSSYQTYLINGDLGIVKDEIVVDLGSVAADEILTIQVLVWVEGWDAECLNAIFEQTLKVDLDFKYTANNN